jgi:PhnB protein
MKLVLNPYLNFNGNAKDAMKFYQSVFGGKLTVQTFEEMKMAKSETEKKLVMHARLDNDSLTLMASDIRPGMQIHRGNNVHLSIMGSDEKELKKIFDSLAAGGKVEMPLKKEFWGDTFGMLTDKFGISWMVNISEDNKRVRK